MKNLEEVKMELEKINREEPDSPIFDFDKKEIYYKITNETKYADDIEYWARHYILIHYLAKIQNKYWAKYEFPLDKDTTKEDWTNRNTERWYKYQKIISDWEHDEQLRKQENNKIKEEWWPY